METSSTVELEFDTINKVDQVDTEKIEKNHAPNDTPDSDKKSHTFEKSIRPPKKLINKHKFDIFLAIVEFVNELWGLHATKKASPLALYHRLIQHIGVGDYVAIDNVISGFETFFHDFDSHIINNKKIPENTRIIYGTSQTVYLEIQKYIHKADNETKEIIRQHLMTISALMQPNKSKIAELEKHIGLGDSFPVDSSSEEGQFFHNIMSEAKSTMETVDTSNPMNAVAGLLQSGLIQKMVTGLQEGVGSGRMNVHKLFGTMHSAMGALMPQQVTNPNQPKTEEISDRYSDADHSQKETAPGAVVEVVDQPVD